MANEDINQSISISKINISKLFGKYSYSLSSLIMEKIVILYGQNGSGKTTILKLLFKALTDRWQLGILLITLLFAVPVITVFSFVFQGSNDAWNHLVDTVLSDYISNSLILLSDVK